MADDAGALLVRSGLVSANALEDARARVASLGGTLGEQLVTSGAVSDDDLTDFYCKRLLVPQVNPNALARLTPKIVATIPSDMVIELRAIPVSFDADNNLTVAMSDPSNRRAVDEIAFFTGVYVVRAVATQMQIAWCLAHYYGHVTALGQRLLRSSDRDSPIPQATPAASRPVPRTKGLTGKVNATRHRAVAPVTGPVDVLRPNSGELDLRPLANDVPASSSVPGLAGAAAATGGAPAHGGALRSGSASASGAAASGGAWLSGSTSPASAAGPGNALPPGSTSSTIDAAVSVGRSGAPGLPRSSPSSTPAPSRPVPVGSVSGAAAPRAAPASTPTTPGVAGAPIAASPGAAMARSATASTAGTPGSASVLVGSSTPTTPGVGGVPIPAGSAGEAASPAPTAAPAVATPPADAAAVTATFGSVPRAAPDAPTLPPVHADPPTRDAGSAANRSDVAGDGEASPDGAPDKPRARSVSGEIRAPVRRAPSIRPPLPEPDGDDDEPLIVIEKGTLDDDSTIPRSRMMPLRRRIVKSDPPELRARAGEVDLKDAQDRTIDADEPRIVVDEDAFAPPTARVDTRNAPLDGAAPLTTIDVVDDADTGALIHDRVRERESQPILLDRRMPIEGGGDGDAGGSGGSPKGGSILPRGIDRTRATPDPFESARPTLRDHQVQADAYDDDDADTGEIIVMLDTRSQKHRPERHTQVGVPPAPVPMRVHHETEPTSVPAALVQADAAPGGVPTTLVHHETDRTADIVDDATKLDLRPAPPGDETTSDLLAAPPSPASEADTNPHVIAQPPAPAPPQPPALAPATIVDLRDDDPSGPRTSVMTAAQLDDAIPDRTSEVLPGHLSRHRIDHDPIDDGWGPPGTTIPPPLLGAIPGSDSDDDEAANSIPMPNIDSSPLMVGPPSPHAAGDSAGRTLVRALEDTTARAIEVIRELEHAQSRDQVVDVMIAHLAETHHRAGFLVTRHTASKGAGELGLFAMTPRPAVMPFGTLRLDRPSTLQDVVGTRLPYRGPMHDDASRSFLVSILGACPPEILLVPVAVRERVVGVLFGEHRHHHTFDDQLALAARAAGMALERILKAKRG